MCNYTNEENSTHAYMVKRIKELEEQVALLESQITKVYCPFCGRQVFVDKEMIVLSRNWHFCPDCSLSFVPQESRVQ
jgi:transposase-like protein